MSLARAWTRLTALLKDEPVLATPIQLAVFASSKQLSQWRVNTDAAFGGSSEAKLQLDETGQYAIFSGRYSKVIQEGSDLVRAGFVGLSTVLPRNVDLRDHDYLEFRVRSHTAHTYMASVRAQQLSAANGEEAWQAALKPTRVGEWEDIRIPLDSLMFTFRGRVSTKHTHGLTRGERARVMALGLVLSATDDMPMQDDFRLDLQSITAGVEALSGVAAWAQQHQVELTAEQIRALEQEQRMLETAKQLEPPGAGRQR